MMGQLPVAVDLSQEEKAWLMAGLTDMGVYRGLAEAISRHTIPFGQKRLMVFYERSAGDIHEEDPNVGWHAAVNLCMNRLNNLQRMCIIQLA